MAGDVVPPPPNGFAPWDDFDRSLPPERQGSAFACRDSCIVMQDIEGNEFCVD